MPAPPPDGLLLQQNRLQILLHLLENDGATFTGLARLIGASYPLFSFHVRKLERAGMIQRHKAPTAKLTTFTLTYAGRAALLAHKAVMAGVNIGEGVAA